MKILFLGKCDDGNALIASKYLLQIFPNNTTIVFLKKGDKLSNDILSWEGDYIFSYLAPLVIPETLLENATKGAINWHPGPPEYPGIGCTNFALYNGEKNFGITCHYMLSEVDSGKIIEVLRFSLLDRDTVYTMTQKCYSLILNSFYSIIEKIFNDEPLPESSESWKRKAYTRKQLNSLTKITVDMDKEEIERRIKATTYDRPWAYVDIHGFKFYYK